MSVALYKYKGDIQEPTAQLLVCLNISTEQLYYEYLYPAITELNLSKFKDGAKITFCERDLFLDEINKLIRWIKINITNVIVLDYFLPRLENIKKSTAKLLEKENDVIYIF